MKYEISDGDECGGLEMTDSFQKLGAKYLLDLYTSM
jgi:hypothetical protein